MFAAVAEIVSNQLVFIPAAKCHLLESVQAQKPDLKRQERVAQDRDHTFGFIFSERSEPFTFAAAKDDDMFHFGSQLRCQEIIP